MKKIGKLYFSLYTTQVNIMNKGSIATNYKDLSSLKQNTTTTNYENIKQHDVSSHDADSIWL